MHAYSIYESLMDLKFTLQNETKLNIKLNFYKMQTKIINCKATYKVAPNIAMIKYWGKFDEDLILPLNSSVSATLSNEDLFALTEVTLSSEYLKDTLFLNGVYTSPFLYTR